MPISKAPRTSDRLEDYLLDDGLERKDLEAHMSLSQMIQY